MSYLYPSIYQYKYNRQGVLAGRETIAQHMFYHNGFEQDIKLHWTRRDCHCWLSQCACILYEPKTYLEYTGWAQWQ